MACRRSRPNPARKPCEAAGRPSSPALGPALPSLHSPAARLGFVGRHALHAIAVGVVALATVLPALTAARENARPLGVERADTIESCVSTTPIRFQAQDRRVLLDAADTAAVTAAITQRYPVLDRDGLSPDGIVLWRKPGAGWLYVTLLANPSRPLEVCFTATFVASRFELTGPLLAKYFGAGVALGASGPESSR